MYEIGLKAIKAGVGFTLIVVAIALVLFVLFSASVLLMAMKDTFIKQKKDRK